MANTNNVFYRACSIALDAVYDDLFIEYSKDFPYIEGRNDAIDKINDAIITCQKYHKAEVGCLNNRIAELELEIERLNASVK